MTMIYERTFYGRNNTNGKERKTPQEQFDEAFTGATLDRPQLNELRHAWDPGDTAFNVFHLSQNVALL